MRYNIIKDNEEVVRFDKKMDALHEKIVGYESLPDEERIAKYRETNREVEDEILDLTGNPLTIIADKWCRDDVKKYKVEMLLGERCYMLSKMFEQHCSDAEVKRFEELNDKLYSLTCDMFSRTGKMFRAMLDMPKDERDDDMTVEGCLRYWGDDAQDVLRLEDDDFYGSRFAEMILINAMLQDEKGVDEIMTCKPWWSADKKLNSSMSDKELGLENYLDDGETWAESWLRLPKFDHVCVCYATHALVTHSGYPIPDFLRLNTFEVKVNVVLQQFSEQDGSRL